MKKINCVELHLKIASVQAGRKLIGFDLSSILAGGIAQLPLARKTLEAVKLLWQSVFEAGLLTRVETLVAKTKAGVEVKIELSEQLAFWRKFYEQAGVDWITALPDKLELPYKQAKAMEALMAEGFDYVLIIPAGLVDEYRQERNPLTGDIKVKNKKLADLHGCMSRSYNQTGTRQSYDAGGKFEGAQELRQGFRILLTKGVQNLEEDELFDSTINKSIEELEKVDGALTAYDGLSEAEYLVFQSAYFLQKRKHLDTSGQTFLPGSRRKPRKQVASVQWTGSQLEFDAYGTDYKHPLWGCRLAKAFPIKI